MLINQTVQENIAQYRQAFDAGNPFKYVVIDNFLDIEFAQLLLKDFPLFDIQKAMSEVGRVGGKAVNENLAAISDNYKYFANYISSPDFLNLISEVTGIEGLINDETFYGGGTHENLHGQELDPHVDFNLDERNWYHRRLNVLIYLNPEWEDSWGGLLEIHSNPRRPEENQIKAFSPIFNRCIIFETNEYSWHGFRKIQLPENKQHLSRKSLSIYLYTKDRPLEEIVPSHTTFYVHRPLPEHIQPGKVLTQEDYQEIKRLLKRRDDLIEFYQDREIKDSLYSQNFKSYIKRYLAIQKPLLWQVLQKVLKLKKSFKS